MAKFKSYIGKQVMTDLGILVFTVEEIEVTEDYKIEALKGAQDVEEVKTKRQKKED